jgi:septal ring factor EnvC (AmiA/AmiB activator)
MCDCNCDNCTFENLELIDDEIGIRELYDEIQDLRKLIDEEKQHQKMIRNELKDLETRIDIIQNQLRKW